MGVSKFSRKLFGASVEKHAKLLMNEKPRLLKKYNDGNLRKEIAALDTKFISLAPMALCESILTDLGVPGPEDLLTGIGLMAFHISTHDDLINERPENKETCAALLYSGNILLLEGIERLIKAGYARVLPSLLDSIRTNHLMQQRVVNILFRTKRPTIAQYNEGIRHIVSCFGEVFF